MIAYSYYETDPRVIRAAEAALEGGFAVDVLTLRRPGAAPEEMVRGVRLLRVNQAKHRGGGQFQYLLEYLRFFLLCFLKSTSLFFTRRYSVIHVNNMPDFLVFSTIIPKLLGAKVLLDIHDPMPNTFASKFKGGNAGFWWRILLWQELLSAAYADQVLTVHEPVKQGILVKQHGLREEAVMVVANFPDDEMFRLRETYDGLKDGKIQLVFHGTILARSGLPMLMQALALVKHKDRVALTVIGEGDYSQGLKDLIAQLGLQESVHFDNRSYPVRQIAERLAECTVGVVTLEISSATNWALPLKLVEYISIGLPVISVRNAAILHYFTEDDCLFFNGDDPASLASAIDRLAQDPDLPRRYRERSVAMRPHFVWSAEKSKYNGLLRRLSGLPPLPAPTETSVPGVKTNA